MKDFDRNAPWPSCHKKGDHEVYNIEKLDSDDASDKVLIEHGWLYRGKCIHCRNSIVSKDGKDLLDSQKAR